MVDLDFQIDGIEPVKHAAAPTLALKLRLASRGEVRRIHSVLLRCQVQIEAVRRRYSSDEQSKLSDLFGPPEEWGRTLRTLLWTHVSLNVPGFTRETTAELPVPCSYDFNIAITKYLDALETGEIPLCLLFSGTVFYEPVAGPPVQVGQIYWNREASCRLPARLWQETMDHYYPNQVWLMLRKDVFERLADYRRRKALTGWEEALEHLLECAEGDPIPLAADDQREGIR